LMIQVWEYKEKHQWKSDRRLGGIRSDKRVRERGKGGCYIAYCRGEGTDGLTLEIL